MNPTEETPTHRGRIVMLVHREIHNDSRVQKIAVSAAEAGWEVFLLGRAPRSSTRQLGGATVHMLRPATGVALPRHGLHRSWLRHPLAYPPNGIAGYRREWISSWEASINERRDVSRYAGGRPPAWLRAESLVHKVGRRWVRLRTNQLTAARQPRRHHGPIDRGYAALWRALAGSRSWRRLDPTLWEYELTFGPTIDRLKPDLIHAHDFRMLGVGARAAMRGRLKGRQVKLVWDAHEYLPGIRSWVDNVRWKQANMDHEREYARYADAVVTVSDTLAEMLRERHRLPRTPHVILNAPSTAEITADGTAPSLRAQCGLAADTPLVVYSGGAAEQRGLRTMVEAMPLLDDVHVAFVVNAPDSPFVTALREQAAALGVAGRLHVHPFVPHDQVVPFLSSADIGVIPIHHYPNHEIALITKFFEYSQARLPIVVSDVKTMAATVRESGQGEVFRAEDAADYARAVRAVLADPARYRAVYETDLLDSWTWEAQAKVLDSLYSQLLEPAS
ncbi:hypothetical protein GCM10010124_18070 [Pilimelia terevasa]|uniref:Glycosyltransferase n=1 Tax=Pilimelia terevasa TaxID=53372 RepID=A0A8J3BJ50_9ACTN|nr:glycosyltransferase family 4 protein [Pilimelia terevasa]GGK25932.1 hypothetical protein GCM10010124_18070 [Pilimelia terevasa]